MVNREKGFTESFRFKLDDGREGVVLEQCHYDSATQVNRITWHFRLGEEECTQQLDMRCFYPLEMDALLTYNGFSILHKFGAHDETPFSSASQKQIFVCE